MFFDRRHRSENAIIKQSNRSCDAYVKGTPNGYIYQHVCCLNAYHETDISLSIQINSLVRSQNIMTVGINVDNF